MVGNPRMTTTMWNHVDLKADCHPAGQNSDLSCRTVFLEVIMGRRGFCMSHCIVPRQQQQRPMMPQELITLKRRGKGRRELLETTLEALSVYVTTSHNHAW